MILTGFAKNFLRVFSGKSSIGAILQTLAARFSVLGVSLVTGMITARCLGPVGRGEQAAMGLWPQFFGLILSFGLPSAIIFNIRKNEKARNEIVSSAILWGLLQGSLAGMAGYFLIPMLLKSYSPTVIHTAQWLMLGAPLALLTEVLRASLEAVGEFSAANKVRYVPALSTLTLLAALVYFHQITPVTATLSYWIPGIPIAVWMIILFRQVFEFRISSFQNITSHLFQYGFRAYGIDVVTVMSQQIDQVFVISLLSPKFAGTYVVSLSLARVLSVFQSAVSTILFPKVAAQGKEEIIRLASQAARLTLILSGSLGLLALFFSPIILQILYGGSFLDSVLTFRILSLETIVSGISIVLSQGFLAINRPEISTAIHVTTIAISSSMMLFFIPHFQLMGAASALLIASMIRFLIVICAYKKLFGAFPDMRPRWLDITMVLNRFRQVPA